jgi:hypothetical protein
LVGTDVSVVLTASIALMMEAVRIYETSFHSNETTRRYIPEDSNLNTPFFILFVYLFIYLFIVYFRTLLQ